MLEVPVVMVKTQHGLNFRQGGSNERNFYYGTYFRCYLILNGFRYSVEVPQDGAFGNINTTGKLTGLIGMLHRKVAFSNLS